MIILKRPDEIQKMRESGRLVAEVLDQVESVIRPGISTWVLEEIAARLVQKASARAAFKGYRVGKNIFPCCLCLSVNEEVVHGIPSPERILQEGDIVSVDFGVEKNGYFGDAARTIPVGSVNEENRLLLRVTREALNLGIAQASPNNRLQDIGFAIQNHAEFSGFHVVRSFVGHGIGQSLHEDPQVPNYGNPGKGARLKAGMVFAIEPMVNAGTFEVNVLCNGWIVVIKDWRRLAHFEYTVAVIESGFLILTCP